MGFYRKELIEWPGKLSKKGISLSIPIIFIDYLLISMID
jgi:hypothetical protein